MTNKRTIILAMLALAAIIGYRTWDDMRLPPAGDVNALALYAEGYLISEEMPRDAIPDDNKAVTFRQGVFTGDTLARAGMKPLGFPQRQVDIVFGLDGLPGNNDAVFAQIRDVLKEWENAGNMIADVYIDYRPAAPPDWQKMEVFVRNLKEFLHAEYRIDLFMKEAWLTKEALEGTDLLNLQKTISFYVFDIGEAPEWLDDPARFIELVDRVDFPFTVVIGKQHRSEDVFKNLRDVKFLAGYLMEI